MSDEYRDHHYVPQWYQKRFMPQGEHEWFYLDLKPETFTDPRGIPHVRRAVKRQGAKRVFLREICTPLNFMELRQEILKNISLAISIPKDCLPWNISINLLILQRWGLRLS
jgi:hypothetical protein